MKKVEITLSIIAFTGLLMKYFHIPFSGVILVIALTFLSVFYYSLSFAYFNGIAFRGILKKKSYFSINAKRLVGAGSLGIAISIVLIGVLFKIQFWPMSTVQILAGLFLLSAVFVFALLRYFKTKGVFYDRILKRIAVFGLLGTVFLLTPDAILVDTFLRDRPEAYRELYKELMAHPNDDELRKEVNEWEEELIREESGLDSIR